ncbi:G2/mitotic-specific cyclin-B3 [Neosynchiropus ocellatus]
MPLPKGRKALAANVSKLNSAETLEESSKVKRSTSPSKGAPKKRTAFIDITNAHKVQFSIPGKKKVGVKKQSRKANSTSVATKNQKNLQRSSSLSSEETQEPETVGQSSEAQDKPLKDEVAGAEELAAPSPPAAREVPAHLKKQPIPAEFDIDSESRDDCFLCPEYAKEIFDYLKEREEKFTLSDYMTQQPTLNPEMRAILIDWLVEVQENFELYHETLYMAVKMIDHFLSKTPIHREMLQLVGSTAMLIASKFEERNPPCLDDFLYICDDAYKREELIAMEAKILQTLTFDINIPIAYSFLRRYAKCLNAGMDTLTLARFYCEMSLMDMDLVVERGSLLASACLLMAVVAKDLGGWSPILQFHTGYRSTDLTPVVRKLHKMLSAPPDSKLKAIRGKYSHRVFFEVASLPLVDLDVLEKALSQ